MQTVHLILPNQLFENPFYENGPCYLIEEVLFFNQFNFHRTKLAYHRASMKAYQDYLSDKGVDVRYIETTSDASDIRVLISELQKEGIQKIEMYHPEDDWLQRRIKKSSSDSNIEVKYHDSPHFLNSHEDNKSFFKKDKKKYYQTSFYKSQRKQRNILMVNADNPVGDKWSYDSENREKYPKDKQAPHIDFPKPSAYVSEAIEYVNMHFKNNPGELHEEFFYPIDFNSSKKWLTSFIQERFAEFGPYEDAIVKEESFLNHSVLSPMMNIGLLTPKFVIDEVLKQGQENDIPINSLEGFVRQVIGWREFIRGIYQARGRDERTRNFWQFSRKIPPSFYDGTTGIPPVDDSIKKVLKHAYNHHIERLMVIGNFMLLCEFDPDEVYKWFMELYIDAYDWVMVPNVYGMSQFADGGLMSTKPYISSSNYILKMSDYGKGDWQSIWDGLFWRFMHVNRDFFTSNPRLGMLIGTFDKMSDEKQQKHLDNAEHFLEKLDKELAN
ncbi:MAG: cryptochrome/photolyase family protein [Saprospiraceae bacterium]|nr:cryptochrome/photolyase family protein [Saprospiraceae bacterium]